MQLSQAKARARARNKCDELGIDIVTTSVTWLILGQDTKQHHAYRIHTQTNDFEYKMCTWNTVKTREKEKKPNGNMKLHHIVQFFDFNFISNDTLTSNVNEN